MPTEVRRRSARLALRIVLGMVCAVFLSVLMLEPARAAAGEAVAFGSSLAATPAPAPVALALPTALPYSDCTGTTPLGRANIYHDTCLPGIYLVGHNPGAFSSLLPLRVGSRVSYGGRTYTIRWVAIRTPAEQWAEAQAHPAVLTMQTCVNDAAGRVWVLTAS
jgi:hypothetical protein